VVLESFPLTANGKIDRKALPVPRPAGTEGDAGKAEPASRSPVEELVAGFLREVLQVECVGPEDNFFELGGNSLLAVQVTSRLRACFGVDLSLRVLFEQPTLGALARRIERERAAAEGLTAAPPLAPRRPEDFPAGVPLSFAQQRLWFL